MDVTVMATSSLASFSSFIPHSAIRNPQALRTFQNPGGSLLPLNDVIVFRRELVGRPRFNSQTFLFGVAIAREKLIHFNFK
jgi:hypothetical protein